MVMTATFELRPLRGADLAAVVDIDARIGGRRRTAFFEKRLEAALAEPKYFIYIACEQDGVLLGYLHARLLEGEYGSSEKVATLDNMGVAPASQGRGIGRALMQEFAAIVRHKGVGRIETQADWRNADFLKFLSAAGFRLAPRQVLEREVSFMDTAGLQVADPYPVLESGDRDYSGSSGDQAGSLARDLVHCRSLAKADLPALVQIDSKLTGKRNTAYYQRKVDEALNESGIRVSMVAELHGRVAGFIMARVDYGEFDRTEPAAVLDSIAVDPAEGHHLVGSALLSQLLANLTGLRLETIRTEVDASHLDVLGFLTRNGFRQSQELAFALNLE